MSHDWPTRDSDLQAAQSIMEEYASKRQTKALGLFEIEVNSNEKSMNYCLSGWIIELAKHFNALYGYNQGNFITRQIVSNCITKGQTLH